jgi:hypothetical protein
MPRRSALRLGRAWIHALRLFAKMRGASFGLAVAAAPLRIDPSRSTRSRSLLSARLLALGRAATGAA